MNSSQPRGLIYRCPICGAEVAVVASRMGSFVPRCCDMDMTPERRRLIFYICPVCGAEIAVLGQGAGQFVPRCCDVDMLLEAA